MKWEDRFFALNREVEVEITERDLEMVARAMWSLGWKLDDQFWAPDLHVSRFIRDDCELFLIQETYFGPKLTGTRADISDVRAEALKIDPNEELFAGSLSTSKNDAAQRPVPDRCPQPARLDIMRKEMDNIDRRFAEALAKTDCHVSLLGLAKSLKDEGLEQAQLYDLFGSHQKVISAEDPRLDAILDTMDLIQSGPWAKGKGLFNKELKTDA